MTSNVELLPPAGWHTEGHLTDKSATTYSPVVRDRWLAKGWPVWPLYTADQVRANVLHHTAPLRYALDNAARDIKTLRGVRDAHAAEIERLRAEREVIVAEALKYADKSGRLEAKVDRLADELRKITELRERHHDNLHDAVTIAEEALRDSEAASG